MVFQGWSLRWHDTMLASTKDCIFNHSISKKQNEYMLTSLQNFTVAKPAEVRKRPNIHRRRCRPNLHQRWCRRLPTCRMLDSLWNLWMHTDRAPFVMSPRIFGLSACPRSHTIDHRTCRCTGASSTPASTTTSRWHRRTCLALWRDTMVQLWR